MAVPKKRHTRSRRNQRRSHHALPLVSHTFCAHCQKAILPHRVCEHCGWYGGREVVDVLAKLEKNERRRRQKELDKEAEGKRAKPLSLEQLSKKKKD